MSEREFIFLSDKELNYLWKFLQDFSRYNLVNVKPIYLIINREFINVMKNESRREYYRVNLVPFRKVGFLLEIERDRG